MMHPKARIAIKNVSALLSGRILVGTLSVFTFAYLGRNLTSSDFGITILAITTSDLFSTISDFGFSYLAVREIARGVDKDYFFRVGLYLRLLIFFPMLVIISCLIFFSYNSHISCVLLLGVLVGSINSFTLFYLALYNGMEKMERSSAILGLQSMIVSISAIIAIILGFTTAQSILIFRLIATLFVFIFVLWNLRKYILFSTAIPPFRDVKELFIKVFPFGIFFIGSVVYFQTDSYQISAFLDEISVGTYQAAMKLVIVLEMLPLVSANALYPTLTKNYYASKENITVIVQYLTKYLFIAGLIIGIIVFALAKEIIVLLYSDKFINSGPLLAVLAFLIPLRYAGHIFGITITISDSQTRRMIATISAAVFNVCANMFVVPRYGIFGAAIISIITSSMTLLFYTIYLQQLMDVQPIRKIFGLPAFGFLVSILTIQATHSQSLTGVGIALLIFFVIIFFTKAINLNDIYFLQKYFFPKRYEELTASK